MKQLRSTLAAFVLACPIVIDDLAAQNAATVLPEQMVAIPGGTVELGSDAEQLIESVKKVNLSPKMQIRDLPRLMSELGKTNVDVAPFFLSRNLITNEQYKIFVEKTGHRFPFHWWRYGRSDDYDQRLAEIKETVKAEENKDLIYWRDNWKALPNKIPVDDALRTKPSADQYPVIYVSWKDAIAFAAWAGMRLPTEAEWVYAAGGTERKEFLWGDDPKGLEIPRGSRYDKIWEVGHWKEKARGPFQTDDMVLHLWEWTNDLGFFALDDDKWSEQKKKLIREKLLKKKDDQEVVTVRNFTPPWKGDVVVCKGGWYASIKSELRLQTRAPQSSIQTRAGIGFRLAKSEPPALDVAASLIKLDYDISYFGGDREPKLADQVGIERYELSADRRLIQGYHALSLVPVNFMSADRKQTKDKVLQSSLERPLSIATLVVTDKIAKPETDPGIYTVSYRSSGMPAELTKALSDGRKALKAAAKAKEKGKEGGKETKPSDGTWAKVLKRFGITDEECLAGGVDFIRIRPGDLKIPARMNLLLLRDAEGNFITSWTAPIPMAKDGKYQTKGARVAVAPDEAGDGSEVVTFDFGVAPAPREKRSGYTFRLKLKLAPENAGGDKWRLPSQSPAAAAGGRNNIRATGTAPKKNTSSKKGKRGK